MSSDDDKMSSDDDVNGGTREKVINSIRSHRNTTQTAVQTSIVEGEFISVKYLFKLNIN